MKFKTSDKKATGGIFLFTAAQTKPQGGEAVAVGEGRTFGKNKVEINHPVSFLIKISQMDFACFSIPLLNISFLID